MIKPAEILDGWKNFIVPDPATEELARFRAKVCSECKNPDGTPTAIKGNLIAILNDELKEIQGLKCGECGCPLSAKVRSNSSECPKNKW